MTRYLIVAALVLLVAGVAVAGDAPWFDMENCAMCANMSSELMMSLSWEQHPITGGIISVTTVPDKHLEAYRAAHAEMVATSMRLQKGEAMEMCGSCTALGMCMMKGPKQEYVETAHGDVWILTSDDAAVVADLQKWAKRNKEEMEKMMKSEG